MTNDWREINKKLKEELLFAENRGWIKINEFRNCTDYLTGTMQDINKQTISEVLEILEEKIGCHSILSVEKAIKRIKELRGK